jgi:F-type H+-transporting ATPase subunit b
MHFNWSTFALQTVNFAILVWLLHRFLYKPVLRLVDARRAGIDKQYAAARAAETQVQERLAALAAERSGIAAERAAALAEAATRAKEEAAAQRDAAEREAAGFLDAARKTLAAERSQALAEARRAALVLAADIAGRLLADAPEKLRSEAWCERIAQYLAALPAAQRDGLTRQLAGGARVTVVTAKAMPPDTAQAWRTQLQRVLGNDAIVDFDADPRLIAGADLHFPNAVLHFSWQAALDAMRAEIEADGDHR